ncbi:MAG: glycosyltransferase [Gammaproteobacteria bacterium]|nr:glycosyltransferase [Gammaproteobacteria bacterium]MBV8307013.1 glycosyltransferase [Gammaproteobacteria bacterium]MBV8403414.1 glycosyltransferase [Gammaproteobacteria bacterium]
MRICFITSSLEPGRDGVGDYTRDLAAACLTQGWCEARLIALNDQHIAAAVAERQAARGAALETLRLPASAPWPDRVLSARGFLQQRPADWVSLQFVCYGFHKKGIAIGLARHLAPLIGQRCLHVMLHELWIGARRGAALRERLVGSLQRRAVCSLMTKLQPAVIHTSNTSYVQLLSEVGIHASLLPLCGSIPIAAEPDATWLERQLLDAGAPLPSAAPACHQWRFGVFGSLSDLWSPEPLFTYIADAAQRAQRVVSVISIGRIGPGERLWRDMQARYGQHFRFARLGERSVAEISMFLQSIDFGIATTPWQLIGKSASTAAMLDHGLPIIVSRDDVDVGAHNLQGHDPLLQRMTAALPEWLLQVRRRSPRESLSTMAARFTADIRAAGAAEVQGATSPSH